MPLPLPATHRLRRAITVAGLAAALLTPAAAHASGNAVVRDCTDDGHLSKTYTQKQYADALKNIPTDVDEYTDCRDVIKRAQLAAAGSGSKGGGQNSGGGTTGGGGSTGGSSGGGGATPAGTADQALQGASDADKAAVEAARDTGAAGPVLVGNTAVTPDELTKTNLGALSTVPTPLLIVLALLALASVAGGASALMTRVRAARSSAQA